MPAPHILGLTRPALSDLLEEIGVGRHHAGRVFRGVHRLGHPIQAIPDLGRHAAPLMAATLQDPVELEAVHDADDGTRKLVVRLPDGARVESVLVPMRDDRWSLCVSSQVGCAMACTFCATGTLGLTRSLTAAEIVGQVHLARALTAEDGRRVSRLVFMGMGEPLHAYDAVRDAIHVLMDDHGLSFGSKHITVSTVGLVRRLRDLARDTGGRVQLALSLHAGTDATRVRIVPTARATSLAELRQALLDWPLPGSRAIMVEVVVLHGINDTEDELDGMTAFMEGIRGIINLIPFNPFPGSPFESPEDHAVLAMRDGLRARGVNARIRWPRGRGAAGACGQLMLEEPRPRA